MTIDDIPAGDVLVAIGSDMLDSEQREKLRKWARLERMALTMVRYYLRQRVRNYQDRMQELRMAELRLELADAQEIAQ
jgi:hypothetical protein